MKLISRNIWPAKEWILANLKFLLSKLCQNLKFCNFCGLNFREIKSSETIFFCKNVDLTGKMLNFDGFSTILIYVEINQTCKTYNFGKNAGKMLSNFLTFWSLEAKTNFASNPWASLWPSPTSWSKIVSVLTSWNQKFRENTFIFRHEKLFFLLFWFWKSRLAQLLCRLLTQPWTINIDAI